MHKDLMAKSTEFRAARAVFAHGTIARLAATPSGALRRMRRAACPVQPHRKQFMEAERINAIGARLADLTQRTQDLRRYL